MEFISQENVDSLVEELNDTSTKLLDCVNNLKNNKELDETQIAFVQSLNITV